MLNHFDASLAVAGSNHIESSCLELHPVHLVDYLIVLDNSDSCHVFIIAYPGYFSSKL